MRGKNVLELGAGCGLTGLACACWGARNVTLTDLESVVSYSTALNVEANKTLALAVQCRALDWCDANAWRALTEMPEVIVASDCVWLRELVPPFCNTLATLLGAREGCVAYAAQLERASQDSETFASTEYLLTCMRQLGLTVRLVHDGKTQIFEVTR